MTRHTSEGDNMEQQQQVKATTAARKRKPLVGKQITGQIKTNIGGK